MRNLQAGTLNMNQVVKRITMCMNNLHHVVLLCFAKLTKK